MADRVGWKPWSELRRRTHIRFAMALLPDVLGGAVLWPRGRRKWLLIDERLGRRERNEACAHELVHDEHPEWSEAQVWNEVARRLVPFEELERLRAWALDNDLVVETWQAAEVFDVTDDLAERAMRLFLARLAA